MTLEVFFTRDKKEYVCCKGIPSCSVIFHMEKLRAQKSQVIRSLAVDKLALEPESQHLPAHIRVPGRGSV